MPGARPNPPSDDGARLAPWRRVGAFLAWLARPESLAGDATPHSAGSRPSPGFLRWLFARETLPAAPPGTTGEPERSFLAWLSCSETLPAAPPTGGDAP
jgi:hypothetical protein